MAVFMKLIRSAASLVVLMTLLLGIAYPLLVTGIAQGVFAHSANGSLIEKDGRIIGSELLGQSFENEWYFWGRQSATAYNSAASSGSNLAPSSEKLLENVLQQAQRFQKVYPQNTHAIPVDLVTTSASGLDPHISVAGAQFQVGRVASTRHIEEKQLHQLIENHTESFGFGRLSAPYVNVLKLNLALDELAKKQAPK
jgi:K+-transporting ATPase KdpC subunit